MAYLVVFIGGFAGMLGVSFTALRRYLRREIPEAAPVGVFLVPLLPVLALGGGLVSVLLFTLWRNPDLHLRLLCVELLFLILLSLLFLLVLLQIRKRHAWRSKAQEEHRRQEARRQEDRFLADYARLFVAIESGDVAHVQELIALGMPYTRHGSAPTTCYEPAIVEAILALHRQENPGVPQFRVSPLEAAVQAGKAEVMRLLLQVEGEDPGKARRHARALAEAETGQRTDLIALIRQNEERSAKSDRLVT